MTTLLNILPIHLNIKNHLKTYSMTDRFLAKTLLARLLFILVLSGGFSTYSFAQSAGTLDTSFGVNGKVITPIDTISDKGYSIAIQSDDKIILIDNNINSDISTISHNSQSSPNDIVKISIDEKKKELSKIFIIDADDWVHNKIVDHVAATPNTDFWYANGGYLVNLGDKKLIRKYGLCRYCGSTFIYDYKKLLEMVSFDNQLNENSSKEEMIAGIEKFPLLNILGNHRYQLAYIRKFGWQFKPIPSKAICWVVNTGENHSGKTGGQQGLPLKSSLLSQFGSTSILASEEIVTIASYISEAIEKLKSYLGWLVTDKTKTKV